jgi:type IV secretory pathway TraG/TraD family ATPase VirD4
MRQARPWWTLPALGVLLMLPAPWFSLALAALLAVPLLRWPATRRRRDRDVGAGVVLGREVGGRRVVVYDRQLAAHGIVLGASGAGKSTTLVRVLSDRIGRGLPVVALDLKGSPAFAQALAAAAARARRPCLVWSLDGDTHWNPLRHGSPSELKDKLIATERFSEPHYRRAAERYLQATLTVLRATQPGRPPTLAQVVALSDPGRLAAATRRAPAPLSQRIADYVASLTPDQLSAIRGLGTRLAIVTESHAGARLEPGHPEIDLRAALRGDAVVVFSLNSSTYGSLAAQMGTIAVQDLVSAAGSRLADPGPPALVAIDEFSALGADQVLALFARGREAGVSVLLATQELSDLDRAARGLRDQVIGNTAVKIVHRQDVPASAHAVAQMTGTERVWEETRQFGGPGGLLPRGTRREVDRFRVSPDAIASLPTGGAVLITKVPRAEVRVVQVSAPSPQPRAPVAELEPRAASPRPRVTPRPARPLTHDRPQQRGPRYPPPPGVTR